MLNDPMSRQGLVEVFYSLVESGELRPDALISERVSPADAAELYSRLQTGSVAPIAACFDWSLLSHPLAAMEIADTRLTPEDDAQDRLAGYTGATGHRPMRLLRVAAGEAFDALGAGLVADWIAGRPDALVMPAVGNTPEGVYASLSQLRRSGRLDTSRIRVAQLDEYLDLERDDPRRLRAWLERIFCEPLAIDSGRLLALDGSSHEPAAMCQAYEDAVREMGGVGVAILGLGPNGHVGFNEPPSDREARTRVVALTDASLASNRTYWPPPLGVPRRAVTAGMSLLLNARWKLLLVAGGGKREILLRSLTGPIGADNPASFLREVEGVTVLVDDAALPDDDYRAMQAAVSDPLPRN